MDVRHDQVHACRHDSQRAPRKNDPLIIQATHQDCRALAFLGNQVLRWNAAVLQQHLTRIRAAHTEFVELLWRRESGCAAFDNERADVA